MGHWSMKATPLFSRHKDIVCRKRCDEALGCGHLCTKRCHTAKPTQHDPCRVPVDKTIVGCGHKIRFQCAQTPTVYDCKQPVLKRLACDHTVHIPCGTASFESELKRVSCPTPCTATLACTHKCVGKCGSCRTGQLHVPCQEKCGRPLICSHVCFAYDRALIWSIHLDFRFARNRVLSIAHRADSHAKHSVFIRSVRRNVENHAYRAKRWAFLYI